MNKIIGKINALILSALMIVSGTAAVTGVFNTNRLTAVAADDTIILRVCNWEEYIDTGDWKFIERLGDSHDRSLRGKKEKRAVRTNRTDNTFADLIHII